MDIFQAIILGIIQGLTEFLPISSSGHLTLLQKMFGIDEGVITFNIAVHLATLSGVFVVYWEEIKNIIKKPFGKLPLLVVVGTIPTAVIGLFFKDVFEELVKSGDALGICFIFTGLILWAAEKMKPLGKNLEKTTFSDAVIVGIAQGIAILPAVSRSGLTLAGSLFRGIDRKFALKFSFLMSIPAILGAATLDGIKLIKDGGAEIEVLPLIIGVFFAAISGYVAIKFMIKIFMKASLKMFSYYVFILGILILSDQFIFNIFF